MYTPSIIMQSKIIFGHCLSMGTGSWRFRRSYRLPVEVIGYLRCVLMLIWILDELFRNSFVSTTFSLHIFVLPLFRHIPFYNFSWFLSFTISCSPNFRGVSVLVSPIAKYFVVPSFQSLMISNHLWYLRFRLSRLQIFRDPFVSASSAWKSFVIPLFQPLPLPNHSWCVRFS